MEKQKLCNTHVGPSDEEACQSNAASFICTQAAPKDRVNLRRELYNTTWVIV